MTHFIELRILIHRPRRRYGQSQISKRFQFWEVIRFEKHDLKIKCTVCSGTILRTNNWFEFSTKRGFQIDVVLGALTVIPSQAID